MITLWQLISFYVVKILEFLKQSNRWKHFLGGIVIGCGADSLYCAAYAGIGVAAALELKDKLHGGECDLVDFSVTIAGVSVGYSIRVLCTIL